MVPMLLSSSKYIILFLNLALVSHFWKLLIISGIFHFLKVKKLQHICNCFFKKFPNLIFRWGTYWSVNIFVQYWHWECRGWDQWQSIWWTSWCYVLYLWNGSCVDAKPAKAESDTRICADLCQWGEIYIWYCIVVYIFRRLLLMLTWPSGTSTALWSGAKPNGRIFCGLWKNI